MGMSSGPELLHSQHHHRPASFPTPPIKSSFCKVDASPELDIMSHFHILSIDLFTSWTAAPTCPPPVLTWKDRSTGWTPIPLKLGKTIPLETGTQLRRFLSDSALIRLRLQTILTITLVSKLQGLHAGQTRVDTHTQKWDTTHVMENDTPVQCSTHWWQMSVRNVFFG